MKNNFKKYLILNVGIILLTIIIAFIAYFFISKDIKVKTDQSVSDRSAISEQNNALASFSKITQEKAQVTPYQTVMDKLLPSQTELISFPDWLQSFAVMYNVFETFNFASGTVQSNDSTPGSINFNLIVDGATNDDISFLKYMESSAPGYLMTFNSFSLLNNSSDTKVTVSGKIFFK